MQMSTPAPSAPVSQPLDPVVAQAVDVARAAAVDQAGSAEVVGEHLGVRAEAVPRVATHFFAAALRGYLGWCWAVTVVRASRSKTVTVDEVVLLPGDGALVAPDWVPWSERVRHGDVGVGDLLPAEPDDERLAPAYLSSDDPAVEEVATEIGLGREQVLSRIGRDDAAERWFGGDFGPRTAMASHAPARCGSCGFLLPVAGALRPAFGVCGNEYAPADGRVVSLDYGCGAHSSVVAQPEEPAESGAVYDDRSLDFEAASAAEHDE